MKNLDDLARGDPVPGSRYFRDFCWICNEPIRVTVPDGCSCCNKCNHERVATRDQRANLARPKHIREKIQQMMDGQQ